MIEIRNWVAHIPEEERHLAYVGENETVIREFLLTDPDYTAYTFHMDMAFDLSTVTEKNIRATQTTTETKTVTPVGDDVLDTESRSTKESYDVVWEKVTSDRETDIASLEKTETPQGLKLTWRVLAQHTCLPGVLRAVIRAVGPEGEIKKTAVMCFDVAPSVAAQPGKPVTKSEFETMEQEMDARTEAFRQLANESTQIIGGLVTTAISRADEARACAEEASQCVLSAAEAAQISQAAAQNAEKSVSEVTAAAAQVEETAKDVETLAVSAFDRAEQAASAAMEAAASAQESETSAGMAASFASSASGYKVTAEFKAAEAAASAEAASQAAASAEDAAQNAQNAAQTAAAAAETAVADERKRTAQLYANALQGECSGQVIRADDVSPVTHDMAVTVQNKNWIPFPYVDGAAGESVTKNGVTFTVGADGSVTANGAAAGGDAKFFLCNFKTGDYLANGEHPMWVHLSGCPAGGSASVYYISQENYGYKDTGTGVSYRTGDYNCTFCIVVKSGAIADNAIFWPQLEIGQSATPYTRYVDDLTTISVHRIRNNWIPYPYWFSGTTTLNGLTFTDKDGVIGTASTATVDTDFPVVEGLTLYTGTYTLSGTADGYTDDWSLVCIDDADGTIYATNNTKYAKSATFTLTRKTQVNVVIRVNQGTYMEGRYFRPMIEWGSSKSDYAPYSDAADYYPDSDGSVNVESLYPTTTLYAEDGIVLNCRYNRDVNKAFEKLEQAIVSLGGTV